MKKSETPSLHYSNKERAEQESAESSNFNLLTPHLEFQVDFLPEGSVSSVTSSHVLPAKDDIIKAEEHQRGFTFHSISIPHQGQKPAEE